MQMFGSIEAAEAEYGKSVAEWKAEFSDPVREQILAQKMQGQIDQSVRSTPAQVQAYFDAIPADSLPLIPEGTQLQRTGHATRSRGSPKNAHAQHPRLRAHLVVTGKMSMTLAATRYSEDPGSKYKAGATKHRPRPIRT